MESDTGPWQEPWIKSELDRRPYWEVIESFTPKSSDKGSKPSSGAIDKRPKPSSGATSPEAPATAAAAASAPETRTKFLVIVATSSLVIFVPTGVSVPTGLCSVAVNFLVAAILIAVASFQIAKGSLCLLGKLGRPAISFRHPKHVDVDNLPRHPEKAMTSKASQGRGSGKCQSGGKSTSEACCFDGLFNNLVKASHSFKTFTLCSSDLPSAVLKLC